jgi:hypothetical protein
LKGRPPSGVAVPENLSGYRAVMVMVNEPLSVETSLLDQRPFRRVDVPQAITLPLLLPV